MTRRISVLLRLQVASRSPTRAEVKYPEREITALEKVGQLLYGESLEGRGFSESCRHPPELRGHLIYQIRKSSPKLSAVFLLAKAWPV